MEAELHNLSLIIKILERKMYNMVKFSVKQCLLYMNGVFFRISAFLCPVLHTGHQETAAHKLNSKVARLWPREILALHPGYTAGSSPDLPFFFNRVTFLLVADRKSQIPSH